MQTLCKNEDSNYVNDNRKEDSDNEDNGNGVQDNEDKEGNNEGDEETEDDSYLIIQLDWRLY